MSAVALDVNVLCYTNSEREPLAGSCMMASVRILATDIILLDTEGFILGEYEAKRDYMNSAIYNLLINVIYNSRRIYNHSSHLPRKIEKILREHTKHTKDDFYFAVAARYAGTACFVTEENRYHDVELKADLLREGRIDVKRASECGHCSAGWQTKDTG